MKNLVAKKEFLKWNKGFT